MAKRRSSMDYIDYDEAYADSRYEADEQLAKQRRKSRPKDRSDDLIPGVVVRALGHHYEVETNPADDEEGEDVRLCEVRGRLFQERAAGTLVAVGDRVWIVPEGNDRGKIEEIEDRTSVISRQKPGASISSEDVILANPDQVLIVFAAAEPEPHLRMLDRFLVVAEFNELPATICVNKTDLVSPERATELFGLYGRDRLRRDLQQRADGSRRGRAARADRRPDHRAHGAERRGQEQPH